MKNKKMKILTISLLLRTAATAIIILIPSKNTKDMTPRQKILKMFYPLIMKTKKASVQSNTISKESTIDFYTLSFQLNDGSTFSMQSANGKKLMIVNPASDCGYTGQYADLEKLYQLHKDSLLIIAFPANDFGNQEKGSDEKIATFCKLNYGITFPLAKKGGVLKNDQQQTVYKWLTDKNKNGWNENAPNWNFCKYIIDEKGQLTHFLNSSVNPMGEEMSKALGF